MRFLVLALALVQLVAWDTAPGSHAVGDRALRASALGAHALDADDYEDWEDDDSWYDEPAAPKKKKSKKGKKKKKTDKKKKKKTDKKKGEKKKGKKKSKKKGAGKKGSKKRSLLCPVLHPELHDGFDASWMLHPDRLKDRPAEGHFENVTMPIEQVFAFNMFSADFCRKLIEEADHCDKWVVTKKDEVIAQVGIATDGLTEVAPPDKTIDLERLGLEELYEEMALTVLRPLIESTWKTFTIQRYDDPYLLKYDMDAGGIRDMKYHHDSETVAFIVYLNTDFEGGGTHFPRWDWNSNEALHSPGVAVMYPGGVSHKHGAMPILSGKRYLFLAAFY